MAMMSSLMALQGILLDVLGAPDLFKSKPLKLLMDKGTASQKTRLGE